ncbi:MAG: hypothetical protein J0L97_03775 [Alphaproteobacteria bacterium]|nr:hypothetical protein [Alphaproteobacteria bacterium]
MNWLQLAHEVSQHAASEVHQWREHIMAQMRQYTHVPLRHLRGEIAYRATALAPEQLFAQAGFVPGSDKVRLSTATAVGAPNNEGLVDFSLVPEVTTLFAGGRSAWIYALPLDIGYQMPGQWRQFAVPALPMPDFLFVRQVTAKDYVHAHLGPVQWHSRDGQPPSVEDETLQRFLTVAHLSIPQDIGLGDEFSPPCYDIRDTAASERWFGEPSARRGF